VLVLTPGLYDYVSAQRRFLWMDKLGKVHDRDFLALPQLLRGPAPVVIDVGANSGQTVLSVKRVLPAARVISFEPNPSSVVLLRRLSQRFPDLRIEAVGLGDREAEADFYTPVYNGNPMRGLASFDYTSARTWLNEGTIFGFRPQRLEIRVERALIRRLDDYQLDPDLIKIDAQGFEDQVVRGAMKTIQRTRPLMLIENPSSNLVAIFSGLGYRACEYRGGQLVPATGTATNQYFVPS